MVAFTDHVGRTWTLTEDVPTEVAVRLSYTRCSTGCAWVHETEDGRRIWSGKPLACQHLSVWSFTVTGGGRRYAPPIKRNREVPAKARFIEETPDGPRLVELEGFDLDDVTEAGRLAGAPDGDAVPPHSEDPELEAIGNVATWLKYTIQARTEARRLRQPTRSRKYRRWVFHVEGAEKRLAEAGLNPAHLQRLADAQAAEGVIFLGVLPSWEIAAEWYGQNAHLLGSPTEEDDEAASELEKILAG